jgi:hypothetical protein
LILDGIVIKGIKSYLTKLPENSIFEIEMPLKRKDTKLEKNVSSCFVLNDTINFKQVIMWENVRHFNRLSNYFELDVFFFFFFWIVS